MSIQDKNTNDLKDLLQRKLASSAPAEDGWNSPSGKVWEGLSEELEADRRRSKGLDRQYLLGAVIVALLAMLLFRECSSHSEISSLKTEMDSLRHSYERLQEDCEQKQSNTQRRETEEHTNAAGAILPPANTGFIAPVEPNRNIAENADQSSSKPTKNAHPQLFPKNKAKGLVQKNPVKQQPATLGFSDDPISNAHLTNDLSKIPSLNLLRLSHSPAVPVLDLGKTVTITNKKSVSFLPSLFVGMALTGNELKGEIPSIISDQRAMLGYRTGIGLEAVFDKHWSLETGVQYAAHCTQTDYQLEVPYTQNNEFQHDDGNFDNEYSHSLPSTMGNYPALLTLTRESSATVDEQEIMPLDLTIEQELRFVSVPLRLHYGFGKAPFRFGVKGGIVANRIFDISSKSVGLVSHHSAIHQRHTSIGNPIFDELQKTTFDYSIGFDARYSVTKRSQVFMEISHQRGLTPIYEEEGFRNFLRSDALLLGISYTF